MRLILIFIIFLFFLGCKHKNSSSIDYNLQHLEEWTGKKVTFPNDLSVIYGEIDKGKFYTFKLVHYFDASCSFCYQQLRKWDKVYKNNTIFQKTNPVFIATGSFPKGINYYLEEMSFSQPVYYVLTPIHRTT